MQKKTSLENVINATIYTTINAPMWHKLTKNEGKYLCAVKVNPRKFAEVLSGGTAE